MLSDSGLSPGVLAEQGPQLTSINTILNLELVPVRFCTPVPLDIFLNVIVREPHTEYEMLSRGPKSNVGKIISVKQLRAVIV